MQCDYSLDPKCFLSYHPMIGTSTKTKNQDTSRPSTPREMIVGIFTIKVIIPMAAAVEKSLSYLFWLVILSVSIFQNTITDEYRNNNTIAAKKNSPALAEPGVEYSVLVEKKNLCISNKKPNNPKVFLRYIFKAPPKCLFIHVLGYYTTGSTYG